MKLKHFPFAVCLLVVTVRSATIPEKDIPVKVVYDENPSVKKAIPAEDPAVEKFASIKNLDEKTQLSQEELADSLKHLPDVMQDASDSIENELKKVSAEVAPPPLEGSELLLLRRAEEIITAGLKTMKLNIQANKGFGETPSENDWKNLNTNVEEFFEEQRSSIKQDAGSGGGAGGGGDGGQNQIVQNIINTFQQATTNFIQNFQQQNKQNGTEDETSSQPPNLAQNFVNYFTGGVQQVVNNIQNNLNQNNNGAGNNSTTLGDTGVSSERPNNIFANVINTIQQAIQGNNQGSPTQIAGIGGNQSDTGTQQPDNNGNFFQTSFNQINQVIQGFRPQAGQQQQQNGQSVQGDEGATTTQRTPIQVIQQIGSSIGNAINNANPFNGQSTKPPNSEDEGTGGTQQPINFFQNIGNVIQGAIRPQQQASTQAPQGGGAASSEGSSNPIQAGIASGAAVGNQIQQLVGGQSGSNPVQSIQNAVAGAAGGSSTEKAKLEGAAEAKPSEPSKLK